MEFLGVGINEDFNPPIQITVVDARNWQKRGLNNELEANQLQVSSLVVLNYADKVDSAQLERVKSDIRYLNPSVIIKDWNQLAPLFLPELKASKNQAEAIEHMKSHWASCSVDLPDPLPSKTLELLMENLPENILRVKGCTRLDNDDYFSFFERTPSKEVFVRRYTGDLITGPKLLVVGPGSNPEKISELLKKRKIIMKTNSNFVILNNMDKVGIVCSGACAIHCLLLPMLAFASPTLSAFFENEWIHLGLLIALIPIAIISFYRSRKVHGNNSPVIFGASGIILLLTAVVLESFHIEIPYLEKTLTGLGSIILIIGHALNMSYLKRS